MFNPKPITGRGENFMCMLWFNVIFSWYHRPCWTCPIVSDFIGKPGDIFLLQIGPASIRTRWNRPPKTQLFKTALQSRIFWLLKVVRASFSACSVDGWKRKFTVSGLIAFVKKVNNERRITLSTGYITIIHRSGGGWWWQFTEAALAAWKIPPLATDTEVNNCFSVY